MAGESLALQNFMVSIGVQLDPQDVRKAQQAHAAVEQKITKTNAAEAEKREKVEAKAAAKREKIAEEAAKKDVARNKAVLTDTEKHLLRVEQVVKRVAATGGAIGGALAGTAVFANIAGVANAYSKLLTEAQRTGASPQNIEALVYSLGQRGVDKGAARSSFGNFARTIQQSPGLKALLSGAGINTSGDTADTFAQLGKYFNKMPYQTALAMAGRYGVDQDSLNALEKGGVAEGMKSYDNIAGSFGLDPDKASTDARGFSNAYDRLAEDLKATQAKIADNFYKPLTTAMTGLSDLLEGNGSKVTALGTAFEGLALTLSVSAIPRLLRFAGILGGITAPPWLLPLIAYLSAGGVLSKQSADAIQGSKPGANDVYVDPETGLATSVAPGAGNQFTGQADKGGFMGFYRRHAPGWAGGNATPRQGRGALGNRLGMSSGPAAGANGRGLHDGVYGPAFGQDAGHGLSARDHYEYLRSLGASENEAMLLTGAAASESSFNPSAIHDGGNGYGMYGHNLGRLDLRGKTWQQQSALALAELRSRDEHRMVDTAKSPDDLADAQMYFERPAGFSSRNPRGGDNYSGRLDTLRKFQNSLNAPPSLKDSGVKFDSEGYALNPDGTRTMLNFNPGSGTVTAPGPQSSNERGDTNYTQHISVSGVQKPHEVADAVSLVARRGAQDHIRFIEGTSV